MKRIISLAAFCLALMPAAAQDTYENANVLGGDLNGTARYVGMGGALEALGADISTIGTNPAGLGLFRHSQVSLSAGLVSQEGMKKFDNMAKTNLSFDQAGFVWADIIGDESFVNFSFNYHKSRNFDRLLNVNNRFARHNDRGASLSKLAFAKSTKHSDSNGGYDLGQSENGAWYGYRNPQENDRFAYPFTQWDYLYTNAYNVDDVNNSDGDFLFSDASDYFFDEANRGWIADFDFNFSGNFNQRVFWGLTVGLHSVNYKSYSVYDEMLVNTAGNEIGNVLLEDDHQIDGSGFDFKAGLIVRPIEDSPFRIGLSVSTPTWYSLTSKNYTTIYNHTYTGEYEHLLDPKYDFWGYEDLSSEDAFEYQYVTPWKFGFSLGHTFDNYLALGASYEYSDYGAASTRGYTGSYDYYGNKNTDQDRVMTRDTEDKLKGVHLLKVGAEYKPSPSVGLRLGYNYQTAVYNDNAFRDTQLNSPGVYFSSTPDFVNWDDTHRFTAGIGYKSEGFSVDLAYQYAMTKGTFHPFQSNVGFQDGFITYDNGVTEPYYETCIATPSSFDFKRHQLLLTLGYTF